MPGFPFELRFSPTWLPTLAAAAVIALTVYLGQWQQGRAAEKRNLQAQWEQRAAAAVIEVTPVLRDAAALQFRSAIARGSWQPAGQIYLDNKFYGDAVGYQVVTPLKIAGSEVHVLVNRGWVARGANYPLPPPVPAPQGDTVRGMLTLPTHKFLELSAASVEGAVWQNLTIERYREALHLDVLPFVLNTAAGEGGLQPVVERLDARAEKSTEYMLTWYSLAITTLLLWIVLNLKVRRRAAADKEPA